MARRKPRWHRWVPWLLFVAIVLPYVRGEVESSFDSRYSLWVTMSLLRDGDLELSEYRELISPGDYRVVERDGRVYSLYPVGPSLLVAPLVVLVRNVADHAFHQRLEDQIRAGSTTGVEKLVASILMALTAVLLFHWSRRRLPMAGALAATGIFAFCTSAWSVASRALWQHGPSILLLTLALWALDRARGCPRWAPLAGLPLAAALVMRPTNVVPLVVLTGYVAWRHRRWLARYLGWVALVLVPFGALNLATYGHVLPWYFRQGGGFGTSGLSGLFEGLAGTLVSPGRGLFVYSSVFLLSLVGMLLLRRRGEWGALEGCLLAVLGLHWWMVSAWFSWWGGSSFGPRLLADLVPIWIYFLFPVLELVFGARSTRPGRARGPRFRPRALRWAAAAALAVSVLLSFWIHRAGANRWETWHWNEYPTLVDQQPERLWDWTDPPFLR